jgi:Uma2 family endonuclease
MNGTELLDRDEASAHHDQRVYLHGVSWKQYELFLEARGESSVPRMSFLEGELELMTPSIDHEHIKKTLARLFEAWADETETEVTGFGSWTIKLEKKMRGAEPDECYVLGSKRKSRPDLAIEVNWTSGGIDKLDIYRGLGVKEVWMWSNGAIEVFELERGAYQRRKRSALLPQMDLALLARLALSENQTGAVRTLRASLRRH